MQKMFLILILIITSIFSCNLEEQTEKEPNNSFDEANPLENEIRGKIKNSNDKDFYKIQLGEKVPSDSVLRISISGLKSFDICLKIYEGNDKKQILVIDDWYKGYGEEISNLLINSNLYYIEVCLGERDSTILRNPDDASEYYYLNYEIFKNTNQIETEPNDTTAEAMNIRIGQEIEGYFTPYLNRKQDKEMFDVISKYKDYSIDWYSFTSAENINISLSISDVKNINSIVGLVDSDKNILFINDKKDFGKGENIANFNIKEQKKYYIFVIGISNFPLRNKITYKYKLSLIRLETDQNFENEKNDDLILANKIENDVVQGLLSPIDDIDYYLVEYNQEDKKIIKATLSGIDNVDLALVILDSNGNVLETYDESGIGENEICDGMGILPSTKLYIKVSGGERNTAENMSQSYNLLISYSDFDNDREFEPNDDFTSASIIEEGKELVGYINPTADEDYLYFDSGLSMYYNLYITPPEDIVLQIEIFDRNKSLLGSSHIFGPKTNPFNIDGTRNVNERRLGFQNQFTRGTYIKVKEQFDTKYNSLNPYHIRISSPEMEAEEAETE